MKNILHLALACLLLSLKIDSISGQEFTYSLLDTRDGLPAATITALAEDLDGHLWVGTEGGLVRYNGYAFQYFFDDPTYIPGKVNAMDIDQLGNIWIGTNTGLARYFEGSFHPVKIAGLDTMSIQRMVTTRNGKIIIATIYDLFILDGIEESAFTYQRYAFPGILYLSEDRTGEVIWIGTIDDLKKYQNGRIKEAINRKLTNNEGVINVWSKEDKLLIGTEDDNIFLYDPGADKIQSVLPYQNDFGDFVGFQIWNDQLWHIYGRMVLKQSDISETRITYPANWSIKSVKTSLVDSDGNLWLGSTEGLIRIRKSCFVNLTFPEISHEIYSLMEDDLHTTWIGTNSGLIYQWDESGVREWKAPEDFGGEVIDMIHGDAGKMWIASYWQGLLEIDQTGTTHYSVEEISELGPDIYDIHLDQDNNLWVGSYRGVFIKKAGEKHFIYGDSLGLPDQCDVYEIQDGLSGVWIAASCGLYHKRGGKLELVHLPDLATDVSIRCLLVDENLLWIGTIGFGLRCYEIIQDGLNPLVVIDQPDRTILDIEKRQRKVWAGTPRVLLEINPDANFHFNIFSSTEGFFEEGYAFLKLFINHRNELFVTTSRGLKKLVDFDLPSGNPRNLIINHLLADGNEIDLNRPAINVPSTTKIIELSYYYPDITRTDFLSYQWKMSDQDEWTDWSNKREINLYSPRPGPYEMEIRVKEANQMLNSKYFNFFVEYAWFQQKWIQIIAGFFLGFIVYYFFTKREKSLRLKQELETQRKLAMASLESRALKAQMNPHFLFNILNNLQEMILAGETELAQIYLTKFSRLMRMILNISSREYIRIEDEIDFLKLYLELEQLRFDHQLRINIDVDSELLTEQIPVFMIQPLVENAIRHGLRPLEGQKTLKIIIDQSESFIRVRVFDNGIGFNKKNELRVTNRENDVHAIDLIRQRLEILSESLGVDYKFSMEENLPEKGMKSQLLLPLQIQN